MSKKGEGVGRKGKEFPSVASPPPRTAYFRTLSQFSSRSRAFGKGTETAATQAKTLLSQCLCPPRCISGTDKLNAIG